MLLVGALLVSPPPVASITREGSAQRVFLGAGLSGTTPLAALLYGGVHTGFSEEFLFRGLIAGRVRFESGAILGPWTLHASVNTTVALSIAVRSAG